MRWGHLQGAEIVLLAPDTPAQVAGPSPATEGHYVNWNLDSVMTLLTIYCDINCDIKRIKINCDINERMDFSPAALSD